MARPPSTLIYGFHEPAQAAAVDRLTTAKRWKIAHWIGVNSGKRLFDDCIQTWHLHGPKQTIPSDPESTRQASQLADSIWTENEAQLVEQLARNPFCLGFQRFAFRELTQRLCLNFFSLFQRQRIELLVFQNLPHEGFELVLYLLAQKLGRTTVLCYQSILPNRFFFCFDLRDFGWFHDVPELGDSDRLPLPAGFRKELFYMQAVSASLAAQRGNWQVRLARRWRFAKIGFKLLKQRLGWYQFLKRPGPRIPADQRYEWDLARHTSRQVDWGRPFVYFPLHLQPELTTSSIGDQFSDQLNAVAALSAWLPRDWQLLVKENPKQTWRQRPPEFFAQLRQYPNVKLVDRQVDTYRLLERCQMAATITGTVGWEAITGGKPVVVFGRPWYLTLPGVWHWPVTSSASDIAASPFARDELARKFSWLQTKSRKGLVDPAYQMLANEPSSESNTIALANFFDELVQRFDARQTQI